MSISSYNRGTLAEEQAAKHIINKGFIILARRFKTKYGEIDLIAKKNNLIVCIEVKFRKYFSPECITVKQQQRIINTCKIWMQQNNIIEGTTDLRLDVIFITSTALHHIENAWSDEEY